MAQSSTHQESADELGYGHSLPRPWSRLRQLLGPERREIVAVVVFAVAVAVLSLATPVAVESLVNTVAFGVLMWPVIAIAAVLMGCLGLAAAIRATQVFVVESVQRRLFVRVVADYADRLPRIKIDAFDRRYGPELGNRFFDVLTFQKSLAFLLLDGIALAVTALVGMAVLAFYHPFLLAFDLVLILLLGVVFLALGRGGVSSALHESHAKYDVAAWLEELLRLPRAFKFAGGPRLALEKADRLAEEYVAARREHFRVVWRQTLSFLGIQVIASTALLGLGGYLVVNRQLTLGQLVAAELIVSLVVASVAKLGKYVDTYYDLLCSAEKLGLLTDLPTEREGGEALADHGRGVSLRVRGLHLVSGRTLPTPADFTVDAGERVAVVGPPGSGKTPFFEALCGLRPLAEGVIEIDGIDSRQLALDSLRERIALVGGREIFAGTVIENIALGRSGLSLAGVREALDMVGLSDAIHDLPQGLETTLTPEGQPLSSGQAARLMIARAVAGRPRMLVLDGALDGLDFRECPELLPRLFDRSAPWTLLVASTSPQVLGRCDRVLVGSPSEREPAPRPEHQGATR